MRPFNFFSKPGLFLLLLFPFSIAAQTISTEKGLTTLVYNQPQGIIKVYLPEDIQSGETISGTVIMSASGKNQKEQSRNAANLQKYSLHLTGGFSENVMLSGSFHFTLKDAKPTITLSESGKTVSTIDIPLKNGMTNKTGFQAPTHALTSARLRISGPFDGNSSTTKCSIDGKEIEILAESPRQCFMKMPEANSGPHTLTLTENGKTIEEKINAVNMEVGAGKLNLQKGEKTFVDVKITGLQNLPSNATLSITNTTTGVVTMLGGESQLFIIPPATINEAGIFTKRCDLQSLRTGSFSVTVDLQLPEENKNETSGTGSAWKACSLDITSCILPASVCNVLQKAMAENLSKQTLLTATAPEENPGYGVKLNTHTQNGFIQSVLTGAGNYLTEQVIFTYKKIDDAYKLQKEKNEIHDWFLDRDTAVQDGYSVSIPEAQFTPGLYNFQVTGYYGTNESYTHSNYIVLPERKNPPTVSNAAIEKLLREEKRLRDSINAINRRIENSTHTINENYNLRRRLDSLRWVHSRQYNQLQKIDALIEQIPGLYGESLKNLLDALEKFRQKAGTLSAAELKEAVDKMQKIVDDLQAALDACLAHLAALQKEQQDLKAEKENIQQEQKDAFRDIMNELRDQGYMYAGYTSRDKSSGGMKYDYGLVLRGAGGNHELVRGIPAQSIKKISALEKKIKDGNKRINEINARQAQLPGEIEKAKAECDEIAARLAKAKEALAKGVSHVKEYNAEMAALAELCSQIKNLLAPLASWCKQNPGACSGFEGTLNQIFQDCPANLAALPNLMNALANIISQKKQLEDALKKQIDALSKQIDELDKKNRDLSNGISKDQNKAEGYGGALDKNQSNQDKAISDELAKRQADEAAKNAERKRVCLEFLKGLLGGDGSEAGLLSLIEAIKEQVQSIGGTLNQGLGAASELTSEKTKEKIGKVTEALDKILGPLEKYDEFNEQLEELKDIKEKLETLASGDDSPEARAKKFGATMGLLKKVLDKIADKVPILQFFTAYFGYLVDGYNAAVDGAYGIFRNRFKEICEAAMLKIDCQLLMNEYMKRNSLDDVYAKAFQLCDGDIYSGARSAEMRRLFQKAVNAAALKKLIDCCLKWSS